MSVAALATCAAVVLPGCGIGGGGEEQAAQSKPPSAKKLRSCLGRERITVRKDFRVPGTPREQRGFYLPEGARYSGAAYWPNGHVADLFVASSDDTASSAEAELETARAKFDKGGSDEKVVKRGLVIYALDDFETPTPKETAQLDGCLQS